MPTSKIILGKTNGLINYEHTAHPWAYSLFKKCQARTWFPRQVNVVKDKNNLNTLTEDELYAYKITLAQLVFNDSAQVRQLDKFFQYITSPVVGALISYQAQQETIHSESYSVMAEDILENTDEIFNMHEIDAMLNKKNNLIASMYDDIYKELPPVDDYLTFIELDKLSDKDKVVYGSEIAMGCVANQIVEQLIFHGGFATMFSLEYKMPGTAEMIKEIYLDEIIHTEIIKFIYKSIFKELDLYNNKYFDKEKFYGGIEKLMEKMNNMEVEWLLYSSGKIPGFTPNNVNGLVNYLNYKISSNLNLPLNRLNINTSDKTNSLIKLLKERAKSEIASRTNFFEANATEYSKSTIKMDY